jgi:hypothetical protein
VPALFFSLFCTREREAKKAQMRDEKKALKRPSVPSAKEKSTNLTINGTAPVKYDNLMGFIAARNVKIYDNNNKNWKFKNSRILQWNVNSMPVRNILYLGLY